MNDSLTGLFLVGLLYLGSLFLIAHLTDSGRIPRSWVANPVTYSLSLGVYATSWSYYGSVGFAASSGLSYLTIYLGVTLAFVLSPVLLRPLLHLTREYQLSSLADLLAFRYRSQGAGALTTLFLLLGTMPYIALQIRAVAESLHVLTREAPPDIIALVFCIMLVLFAVLFGARHVGPREKHLGLVAAIAFESLVKLVVILVLGLYALVTVFHGMDGLDRWLVDNPQALQALYQPVNQSPWTALIFLAFCAAFLLPRQFHMLFAENLESGALRGASWGLPLFLLLLTLPVPVFLWAGQSLQLDLHPDYYVLGVTLSGGPGWMSTLAFIGGLSAASAMVIVTSLALASMCLNHLLLPASYPDPSMNLYRWILWGRRLLVGLIIMSGYWMYVTLRHNQGLVELGLVSFVAVAQFLPGIVGLLYWRRANRNAFIAGLLAGATVWTITLLAPLMHEAGILLIEVPVEDWVAASGMHKWALVSFLSVGCNLLVLIVVSLLTRQDQLERSAAQACCSDTLAPLRGVVAARSVQEFRDGLAETLGPDTAKREVSQALNDLDMSPNEQRANELRRLRERIERNLSGLLGPQLAHMIVNRRLRMDPEAQTALTDSLHHFEERLEASRSELQGLNVELDRLRRLHRQILQELPLGVCALDHLGRIVLWNQALETMTGIQARQVAGGIPDNLQPPWNDLLGGFMRAADEHAYRMELAVAGMPRWYTLHKASYDGPALDRNTAGEPGLVMIVEDLTDLGQLEAELTHSDRLASVGRLAAGVAHEIGNPVTGIASLAQNLRYETDPREIAASVEDIIDQTRRIAGILKTLQSFSRGSLHLVKHENFALCEVVEEARHLVELTHKHNGIDIVSECDRQIRLCGSRQQLSQVLVNLLNNAIDASQPGQQVQLTARTEQQQVRILVEDQGSGIPEDLRDTVLEPFYTTKPTGQGTGLGLSLVYRIIEDHGGSLQIESSDQGTSGTRMSVLLPLIEEETCTASF